MAHDMSLRFGRTLSNQPTQPPSAPASAPLDAPAATTARIDEYAPEWYDPSDPLALSKMQWKARHLHVDPAIAQSNDIKLIAEHIGAARATMERATTLKQQLTDI